MTKKSKRITLLLKVIFVMALILGAISPAWGCTSLLVGKDASADGSTIITYAADSHVLYGALRHTPAATHPKGSMREVREWDTNKHLGYIPEDSEMTDLYRWLYTAVTRARTRLYIIAPEDN